MVLTLARGLRDAGHEAAVAAAPGPLARELEIKTFRLPLVRRHRWRLPLAAVALRRAIKDFDPNLVHAHNPGIALVSSFATSFGRRPRALVSVHGVPDEDYGAAARALRLAALPAVACGPGVAAALEDHGVGVLATIVNGIGPAPPAADRVALDREWGLAHRDRLVVAVGRLVDQKHHDLAVRAFAEVPDAKLVVLGDGPLRPELEREAERSGVRDRVVLAGVRDDARAVMAAADAVVLPSRWEGLPLVALEALAAGTPLVATAVRGTRELLSDSENCLLVPPDDTAALAQRLRRVLDDGELAQRLVLGGRALAERHSETAMVETYLELYWKLAA